MRLAALLRGGDRGDSERRLAIYPAALRKIGDDPAELYEELRRAFTHFVDLNRRATGRVVPSVDELSDVLR